MHIACNSHNNYISSSLILILMPTLQIRDVPEHIMQGLSFHMHRYQQRLNMLEGLTQFRENYQDWAHLDAAELIREDRDA